MVCLVLHGKIHGYWWCMAIKVVVKSLPRTAVFSHMKKLWRRVGRSIQCQKNLPDLGNLDQPSIMILGMVYCWLYMALLVLSIFDVENPVDCFCVNSQRSHRHAILLDDGKSESESLSDPSCTPCNPWTGSLLSPPVHRILVLHPRITHEISGLPQVFPIFIWIQQIHQNPPLLGS